MTDRLLPFSRPYRLAACAAAVAQRAREMAEAGDNLRAMRASAIAEALHFAAGGDHQGARLARIEARWLKRAAARNPT